MTNSTISEGRDESFIPGINLTWIDNKPMIYLGVFCAVVSCFISFLDLREHLSRFDYPKIQVLEMRVLLMIPVFAVLTAASLIYPDWRFFFTTLRDTYESFILYMFFMLMIAYCGGEGQLLRSLKAKRYKGVHLFPMCWLPTFDLDTEFYLRCKRWVLQCALIKPVTSFIAMVGSPLGIYSENNFSAANVYTYTCILLNFSLTWALYYLVLFEVELEKELYYAQTFLKFLCVKSIIFFSYWQSVCVTILVFFHIFNLGSDEEEKERISCLLQDLLMCYELVPVAFLHRAAFGREKLDKEMASVPVYMKEESSGGTDLRSNVDTALSIHDVVEDTLGTIFYRRGKLVDQENAESGDDAEGMHFGADEGRGHVEMFTHDPTLEDLVKHAVANDYGVRVDGVVHFDEDSDREGEIGESHFGDTDVILWRSKGDDTGDVRVDTDFLRASHHTESTPQVYCVVCGRFDREMVKRRNGYKCRECVGTKSQRLLRERQVEFHLHDVEEDDEKPSTTVLCFFFSSSRFWLDHGILRKYFGLRTSIRACFFFVSVTQTQIATIV
eukprot:gene2494-1554_t